MAIEEVLSAPRSPWQRAYVERVIGTIRRECLDHVIVFNERSLYRYLRDFIECLVAAPRSTHQPGVPAPPLLEFRDVPLNPAQNGRVREFDPALAHHIHQIARTQFVTEIPPDTQDDDLLVEMSPFK